MGHLLPHGNWMRSHSVWRRHAFAVRATLFYARHIENSVRGNDSWKKVNCEFLRTIPMEISDFTRVKLPSMKRMAKTKFAFAPLLYRNNCICTGRPEKHMSVWCEGERNEKLVAAQASRSIEYAQLVDLFIWNYFAIALHLCVDRTSKNERKIICVQIELFACLDSWLCASCACRHATPRYRTSISLFYYCCKFKGNERECNLPNRTKRKKNNQTTKQRKNKPFALAFIYENNHLKSIVRRTAIDMAVQRWYLWGLYIFAITTFESSIRFAVIFFPFFLRLRTNWLR